MADNTDLMDDEAPAKKGGMGTVLLLIPVLLVGFGGGGFLAATNYEEIVVATRLILNWELPEPPPPEDEKEEFGVFYETDPFIVNPRGSDGMRVLSCKVGLEGKDEKIIAEVESKLVVITAVITQVLSEQTTAQLNDVEYRNELREKIRTEVNRIMDPVKVDRVYFTTFILQ